MRSKRLKGKLSKAVFVIACILAALLLMLLLSETVSQLIYLVGLLICLAWLVKRGLETAGGPEIIAPAGTILIPVISSFLAKSPAALWISMGINGVVRLVCGGLGMENIPDVSLETSIVIFFSALFVIMAFLHRSPTAMGEVKRSTDPEFREKNYVEKSRAFCRSLSQRLEAVNNETNWNESLFTPLDAEVEVCVKGRRKKKFSDLLKCLKSVRHKGAVFLVLGDPGAGKSVALRKLCAELLEESARTGRIPVYINLKKWNQDWSMNRLPAKKDLIEFIETTLRENGDVFTDSFLDTYFYKMLEDGRWYFVFDSFDEMPCLMGKQNSQELIGKISELLCQFITGENQNGGIIASRFYKSPAEALKATVTLKIRRFTDIKIKQMLNKYLNNAEGVVRNLFKEREDLVSLCRNPFYLALLADYVRNNSVRFPDNQMDLYSAFVTKRLHSCAGKLEAEGFSEADTRQAAKELAVFMQNAENCGLECPLDKLSRVKYGETKDWRKALRLLDYAKICRFSEKNETVTFVHRRFQEFFLVESILEHKQSVERQDYQSIVNGSGMRDALVLYCEVADEQQVQEIACFCWDAVKNNARYAESIWSEGCAELVNALYFMTEAFRNRRSVIESFREDFEQLVQGCLNEKTDLVVLFALVESMVLFDQKRLQDMVVQVFRLGNRWMNDVVVENCRVIEKLSGEIESRFVNYILHMDIRTFWERFENMRFSLSISKAFRYVRTVHSAIALLEVTTVLSTIAMLAVCGILGFQSAWAIGNIRDIAGLLVGSGSQTYIIDTLYRPSDFLLMVLLVTLSILLVSVLIMLPGVLCFSVFSFRHDSSGRRIRSMEFADVYPIIRFMPLLVVGLIAINTYGTSWALVFADIISLFYLVIFFGTALLILCHEFREFLRKKLLRKLLRQFLKDAPIIAITSIVTVGILAFILRIMSWLDTILEPVLNIIVFICTGLGAVFILVILLVHLIRYIFDWHQLKKQPDVARLSRREFAENIARFRYISNKIRYVELLREKNVEFIDRWPDGIRPKFGDDRLNYSLAKLDCAKLDFGSRLL